MKKKKRIFLAFLCICMFITMAFSAYAAENQDNEPLQPGWIKVSEYRYENPATGEYFAIKPSMTRDASVSFSFKIKYSFNCPTKFQPSSSSASITAIAWVEDRYGGTVGETHKYEVYIGTKKASFTTGSSSSTKSVTGLRSGSSYTVSVSTPDDTGNNYVVGNISVQ